eukprot:2053959-Rhodomonas_salina.1
MKPGRWRQRRRGSSSQEEEKNRKGERGGKQRGTRRREEMKQQKLRKQDREASAKEEEQERKEDLLAELSDSSDAVLLWQYLVVRVRPFVHKIALVHPSHTTARLRCQGPAADFGFCGIMMITGIPGYPLSQEEFGLSAG